MPAKAWILHFVQNDKQAFISSAAKNPRLRTLKVKYAWILRSAQNDRQILKRTLAAGLVFFKLVTVLDDQGATAMVQLVQHPREPAPLLFVLRKHLKLARTILDAGKPYTHKPQRLALFP
ncbi:MAG: hypothetical protein ABIO94_01910, partial [Opitutaceae bacterium]